MCRFCKRVGCAVLTVVVCFGFVLLHGMDDQLTRAECRKRLRLSEGTIDVAARDAQGQSPLHRAVKQDGDGEQMAELLLQLGGPDQLSFEDDCGRTPLDLALADKRVAEIDLLLFNGAPCKTDLEKLAYELGGGDPITYLLWQYGRIRRK